MSFSDEMKEHLAAYRTEVLGRKKMGKWRKISKPHILTQEDKAAWNYLPEVRPKLPRYVEEHSIKLHQYFAHLNSSQALALNLFLPLMPRDESGLAWGNPAHLNHLLGNPQHRFCNSRFEAILDKKEKTNFDWIADIKDGGSVFCEVKYTESRFGSASSTTTDYAKRFKNLYCDRLKGVIQPTRLHGDQLKWFKKNYQILRNLSYLSWGKSPQKNLVLFVLPERSPSFRQLEKFIDQEVLSEAKEKIFVKDIAEWTAELEAASATGPESKHWEDFRQKYIPYAISK